MFKFHQITFGLAVCIGVVLIGCNDGSLVNPNNTQQLYGIVVETYSARGESYAGLPVGLTLYGPKGTTQTTWDFGDGETGQVEGYHSTIHKYAAPGTYTITATALVSDAGRTYFIVKDTSISVHPAPRTFGNPTVGEWGIRVFQRQGGFNILYELIDNSTSEDYYFLHIDENGVASGIPMKLELDWYPHLGSIQSIANDRIALVDDYALKIFNPDGQVETSYYLYDTPLDMKIIDDNAILVFDSVRHAEVKRLDLQTGSIVRHAPYFGVADYTLSDYFILNESQVAGYFWKGDYSSTSVLTGANLGGTSLFSKYFPAGKSITAITNLANGFITNNDSPLDTNSPLFITRFDSTLQFVWQQEIPSNGMSWPYSGGKSSVVVKEVDSFIYLFFGNMRCVKLSQGGEIIWDHSFFRYYARFDDVILTPAGHFLMFGTVNYDRASGDYQAEAASMQLLFLTISKEGNLIP